MDDVKEEWQYIRGLYNKSNWEHPLESKEVEFKLDSFEKILTTLNKSHSIYVGSNLTLNQQHICNDIRNRQTHRVWLSDKKMVPVWCETGLYTKRGVLDHIGNNTTYKKLTKNTENSRMVKIRYSYESVITRSRLKLSDAERTYIWRSIKKCDKKISRFISLQRCTRPLEQQDLW